MHLLKLYAYRVTDQWNRKRKENMTFMDENTDHHYGQQRGEFYGWD